MKSEAKAGQTTSQRGAPTKVLYNAHEQNVGQCYVESAGVCRRDFAKVSMNRNSRCWSKIWACIDREKMAKAGL